MNKKIYILVFIVLVTLSRKRILAQQPLEQTPFEDENVDDLGNVSDAFQVSFFEALKQKGIENYDRAISALDKCILLEPEKAILYFERGKNNVFLKNYDRAIEDFKKSLEINPNDKDVLIVLYDVYYTQRDYTAAEKIVKELMDFDIQYKEDLARIYTQTKRYNEALDLLDELEDEYGPDLYRDQLKNRLYMLSGNTERQVKEIEENIVSSPKSTAEYLKLIFLYSEQGNSRKAYETALELQKVNPEADEVQLALYKFYLIDNKTDLAVAAMQKVLESKTIALEGKHNVLNDFLIFVNENPQFEMQLENAITVFDKQVGSANIFYELAVYYLQKGDKVKALPYFKKALATSPEDLEIIKNIILLQLDEDQFLDAEKTVSEALDLYPSQPLLYLTYGVTLNKQNKFKEAIIQLETGIDYIIDDVKMEADFYNQLGDAYSGTGDSSKAKSYYEKVKSLQAKEN
ncbi:tetratricopeptide repeat protein [Dokdonia sp. Hel_I_53]|uniref:tetratricopeptide repeat protein n=1 Tax=Dokdonia sp. Hel_I_53 TaxID=1566287 RepID=UPI00119914BF|nr:tetratricopeptide repeat protein [Dokdonia sp. Hel_I_53]TVZ52736.1 tetratricopeptide repeat protein [Dokdonia sp. Hel_I_53]